MFPKSAARAPAADEQKRAFVNVGLSKKKVGMVTVTCITATPERPTNTELLEQAAKMIGDHRISR